VILLAIEQRANPVAEGDIAADALLSAEGDEVERWQPADRHRHPPDDHRHADDIATLALSFDEPVDWTRFGIWLTMLLHRHGDALLRVKGILNVTDAETPVAVHAVQHLVHSPRHLGAWPDGDRRLRLVFIARGLDPAVIERSFRAFSSIHIPPIAREGSSAVEHRAGRAPTDR
jgi:G3E family GTPase